MQNKELVESALYDTLPLRDKINVDKIFGLEIEMGIKNEDDMLFIASKDLRESGYERKFDNTIRCEYPVEIVSPKLYGNDIWEPLCLLSERMKKCDLNFNYASFQVNMDVSYSYLDFCHFLLFFRTYEYIIFKFSMSFQEFFRSHEYSKSLKDFFRFYMAKDGNTFEIEKLIEYKRYCVEFKLKDGNKTYLPDIIEFRSGNGCDDVWIWQNYINTFYYLEEYIHKIDLDLIDYDLCHLQKRDKPYSVLWLEDALKFANTIFKEDIDKIYFLRQYIGYDLEEVKKDKRLLFL